eukprot:TRINITY_DN3803_c0_g1_i1.p1 TRINITY_DN3803_c0_g1~~TRINITY_DN3803_c0_g1_i1.p1  ORF type:complete len:263 (-),score=34.82 TRINITY_DN3803_c0_g1_i1:364-1152(-)
MVINNSESHTTCEYYQCKIIGYGRDSIVFAATNDCNVPVCIKIEPVGNDRQLLNELSILQIIKGCRGVPTVLFTGTTTYSHNQWRVIVTDVLGDRNLAELRYKMSSEEIISFANDALDIIQNIHKKGIAHNDIKPEHFVFCKNDLYLIDYGAAGPIHSNPPYITEKYASPDYYSGVFDSYAKCDFDSLWFSMLSLIEPLPWDDDNLTNLDIFYFKTQMLPCKFVSDNTEHRQFIKKPKLDSDVLRQLAQKFELVCSTEIQSE